MNHVRIKENKIKRFFLAAMLIFAFGCMLASACLLNTPNVARAEVQNLSSGTNASLFLPKTYEQFLALDQPSDVALSDLYIAVADGKTLYVYDHSNGRYSKKDVPDDDGIITKIGFAEKRLFVAVRASSNVFYEYDFSQQSFKDLGINCSTFCISDDTLYTATIGGTEATIAYYTISQLSSENHVANNLGQLKTAATLSMTKLGSLLYCTIDDRVYHIDPTSGTFDETVSSYLSLHATDATNVRSTCAHGGAFYYTADGGLYRAEFSTTDNSAKKATCVIKSDELGALTSYGGSLYCIREKSVLRFDPDGTDYKIADYEISSASASVGRLSNASDIARAGDLVVIADTANKRVTVYDGATGKYSVLTSTDDNFSPTLVATDGTTIAAVSENKVYVCNDVKTLTFGTPETISNIKGIACVYGSVYYVTQNDTQGKIGGSPVTKSSGNTPTALTSDLYGNLYVAYNDNSVRSFTEEEFITQSAEGGTLLDSVHIPSDAKALRADFEGNLYYLDSSGKLYKQDGTEYATVDGKDFVYTGGESKTPVSFALGFEDDSVYFLFGDYIVRSRRTGETEGGKTYEGLGFPTLETVSKAGVAEKMFTEQESISLYTVEAGTVGISVDSAEISSEGDYFGYDGYARTDGTLRGVLLSQVSTALREYLLLALYEEGSYRVALFPAERCEEVTPKTGDGGYWTDVRRTAYAVSNVSAYYFPCLVDALKTPAGDLARGTQVTVLATLSGGGESGIGYDYAFIEYAGETRAAAHGFVPLAVLSETSPFPAEQTEYRYGYLKGTEDGVTFADKNGNEVVVKERTYMRFVPEEDGSYLACYEKDGVLYTARVGAELIENGESEAWRYALIIGLSVLALVIVGVYVYLLPRKKK